MEENKNKKGIWWKPAVEIFSEISSWIAVPIVLALIVGKALDKHFGTKPWLLLISAGISFLVSSYGIVKSVKRFIEKTKEEIKKTKPQA
jgi:F0F1-type ATP synthase assembly protein I